MDQPRGDADFLQEPARELARRPHGRVQHLERHDAIVAQVARLVDRGHAAGPDLLAHLVLGGEGGAEAGKELGSQAHRNGQTVSRSDGDHTPNCFRWWST